jgi:hypothetical protein
MANTAIYKQYSSDGNLKKGTISVWCKFSNGFTGNSPIFGTGDLASDSNSTFLSINGNGFGNISTRQILFGLRIGGGTVYSAVSSNILRDINAWYHIVVRFDNTLGTPNCDIYVNGEEVLYSSNNWGSLSTNSNTYLGGSTYNHRIGRGNTNALISNYFDGCMSHLHYCDGYYYAPTEFGETDSTTGEWKIKTSPSVSYGTNGFWFFKDDNALTDHSPNSNSYAVLSGTLTKTEDCPSNVFATLNPLIKARSGTPTFGNGNTTYKSTATGWDSGLSTIMPSSGKWYFEVRPQDNNDTIIGLVDVERNSEFLSGTSNYGYLGYKGLGYQSTSGGSGVVYRDNSNAYTGLSDWSANDTCGVAIDLDNQEMFLHINGTYTNSGNPATRANPYDFSSVVNSGNSVAMGVSSRNNFITYVNFGNGYFQTTAVSSAGTNASNNGIFEYDVPTGYTALSTKGLNL